MVTLIKKTILVQIILHVTFMSYSQTYISEANRNNNISGGTTVWSDSWYIIEDNVTILDNSVLQISATSNNILVEVDPGVYFTIIGTITAQGSSSYDITFTESTTNSGWTGINISNNSNTNLFSYCIFENIEKAPGTCSFNFASCGAVYLNSSSNTSFDNCTFNDNEVCSGGGIASISSLVQISDCTFESNTATIKGGGIYVYDADDDSYVEDCEISDNGAYLGGGMYMESCSLVVSYTDFLINSSTYGGAAYLVDMPNYPYGISSSYLYRNNASSGGGIYIDGGEPYIYANSIEYNETDYQGGGITLADNTTAWIYSNTIENNTSGYYGGGIYCTGSQPEISYNGYVTGSISYNKAGIHGGGLFFLNSDPVFFGNHIENNEADYDDEDAYNGVGGGIYYSWESGPIAELNDIALNEIRENSAYNGAGMFLKENGTGYYPFKIINNLIAGNIAENRGGGIYFNINTLHGLNSNTIVDNEADAGGDNGGGVYSTLEISGTNSVFFNNLVYFNTPNSANSKVAGIYNYYNPFGYSNIEGKSGTSYNSFDSTPVFYNKSIGNYHLKWSPIRSPSLDMGGTASIYYLEVDLDNNDRILFNYINIGCYEQNHSDWLIWIDNSIGFEEESANENVLPLNSQISVFPNPIKNLGKIVLPQIDEGFYEIRILDLTGKFIFSKKVKIINERFIDINFQNLSSGVYMIKLFKGHNQLTMIKFIKE